MIAKVMLSRNTAAIRRGSRRREASRRSARRKTPGAATRPAVDDVGQVDDDPAATARRARDGLQTGGRRRGGHRPAFSHAALARVGHPRAAPDEAARRLSSREARPGSAHSSGRWNRHDHRRRGGQGPRPRHPEPLRRARRGRGRHDRRHQHGVVARPRGGRTLSRGLRRARHQEGPPAPRGHPPAGQRRDRGDGRARRDRRLPDRRQPAPPVVDHRRHAPGRRHLRAVLRRAR